LRTCLRDTLVDRRLRRRLRVEGAEVDVLSEDRRLGAVPIAVPPNRPSLLHAALSICFITRTPSAFSISLRASLAHPPMQMASASSSEASTPYARRAKAIAAALSCALRASCASRFTFADAPFGTRLR